MLNTGSSHCFKKLLHQIRVHSSRTLITDNGLIVFECIHALQNSSDGKGKLCGYKLDLAKAYDRVARLKIYRRNSVEVRFHKIMDYLGHDLCEQ
jgi:hypothetical protein